MKAASLNELKKELQEQDPSRILELCMRIIKYKKENKELLTYLLFEAHNEAGYIDTIKSEMDGQFEEINKSNLYLVKKSLRKILRTTNKYIKYSGSKQTEVELLIYFCTKLKNSGIKISKSVQLFNLYEAQLKKINKSLSGLHEDIAFDYQEQIQNL